MTKKPAFATEAALCAAFIEALPEDWTAYPETGGFDILLVRKADGFQIGVEAKLRLNAKVICQAAEKVRYSYVDRPGPDCRAVLVPEGVTAELGALCPLIGVTPIRMRVREATTRWGGRVYGPLFTPSLPDFKDGPWHDCWYELCPSERLAVPDWVPDVSAGASAPVALTDWKVRAIKIVITMEKRGFVTRKDFAHFKISMSRWTQGHWLQKDGNGGWIAGPYLPDFRAQHPVNYPQIEADYLAWKNPKEPCRESVQGVQGAML